MQCREPHEPLFESLGLERAGERLLDDEDNTVPAPSQNVADADAVVRRPERAFGEEDDRRHSAHGPVRAPDVNREAAAPDRPREETVEIGEQFRVLFEETSDDNCDRVVAFNRPNDPGAVECPGRDSREGGVDQVAGLPTPGCCAPTTCFVEWRFRPSNPDPHLDRKLLSELPGILNLALDGLDRLQARGGDFPEPEESKALKMEYRLVAPRDGTVESVRCKEGDRVELGHVLVTLAP